jgi:hypothetical protein
MFGRGNTVVAAGVSDGNVEGALPGPGSESAAPIPAGNSCVEGSGDGCTGASSPDGFINNHSILFSDKNSIPILPGSTALAKQVPA